MPWVAAAAVVGAGVGANATKKASKAQQDSARQAMELQSSQYETSRMDSAPYRAVGTSALNRISDLLGLERAAPAMPTKEQFTSYNGSPTEAASKSGLQGEGNYVTLNGRKQSYDPVLSKILGGGKKGNNPYYSAILDDAGYAKAMEDWQRESEAFKNRKTGTDLFEADPGYQFRLGEGNKSIENAARARGQYFSPSTVKELTRYGQGFASNEFGNVYNRLAGLAGTGQTALNNQTAVGQNYANNVGGLLTGAANARGAAAISNANTWGNALTGAANNYSQNQMLKQIMGGGYSPNSYGTGNINTMNSNDAASWWGG